MRFPILFNSTIDVHTINSHGRLSDYRLEVLSLGSALARSRDLQTGKVILSKRFKLHWQVARDYPRWFTIEKTVKKPFTKTLANQLNQGFAKVLLESSERFFFGFSTLKALNMYSMMKASLGAFFSHKHRPCNLSAASLPYTTLRMLH